MDTLFTVDYALNFEGWQYDKNVAPYNYYTLDQFNIKVRRNDFYLVLFIRNACNELVFCDRIYTINEYNNKVKKKLNKWKCRKHSSLNPTPGTQPPAGIPASLTLTYEEYFAISPTNIFSMANEESELLTVTTIPDIVLTPTLGFPQWLTLGGTAPIAGTYTDVLTFRGLTSGVIFQVTLTIISTPIIPPPPTVTTIRLEDNSIILTEDNNYILTE